MLKKAVQHDGDRVLYVNAIQRNCFTTVYGASRGRRMRQGAQVWKTSSSRSWTEARRSCGEDCAVQKRWVPKHSRA